MVGLRQFEVRFYADREPNPHTPACPTVTSDCGCCWDTVCEHDDHLCHMNDRPYCDLVSVFYMDHGRVGAFLHCKDAISDEPGDEIEGIGGEYAEYFAAGGYHPTVSYLSDDYDLMAGVLSVLAGDWELLEQ